jgi:formamidopyrimidine-DNA glycosylase
MSEGPEVKRTVDKFLKLFLERQLITFIVKLVLMLNSVKKIIGSEVKEIETFGKNIVIAFSTGIYLRNHMLMWGKWRIYGRQQFDEGKAKAPPRRKSKLTVRGSSNANSIDLILIMIIVRVAM